MGRHPLAGGSGLIPGSGDPLDKEMATHSSILAWEMPQTEKPDGPQSMGHIKVGPNRETTNRSISKDHTQVCVCVSCLYLPLALLEFVSEASSLSASDSPDTGHGSVPLAQGSHRCYGSG